MGGFVRVYVFVICCLVGECLIVGGCSGGVSVIDMNVVGFVIDGSVFGFRFVFEEV